MTLSTELIEERLKGLYKDRARAETMLRAKQRQYSEVQTEIDKYEKMRAARLAPRVRQRKVPSAMDNN